MNKDDMETQLKHLEKLLSLEESRVYYLVFVLVAVVVVFAVVVVRLSLLELQVRKSPQLTSRKLNDVFLLSRGPLLAEI